MGRRLFGMPLRGALAMIVCAALTHASGCTTEPPEPPDPGDPTPAVTCEENGPLSLTRTSADSTLAAPPWIEVCSLCPSDALEVGLFDGDAMAVPSFRTWVRGTGCAVAVPTEPIPEDALSADVRVVDGERSGRVDLPVPVSDERGSNPDGLDGMTFVLEWAFARSRHPHEGDPRFLDIGSQSLLLAFGAEEGGSRTVTLGVTEEDGETQDLCEPTHEVGEATVRTRQVGGALEGGSIPQPTPVAFVDGAVQGRLNEAGSGLFDVVLAARLDLLPLEPVLGPAADVCAGFVDLDGVSACGPCTPPEDGAEGEARCVSVVWEWAAAARAESPLQTVDAEALPPDCNRERR